MCCCVLNLVVGTKQGKVIHLCGVAYMRSGTGTLNTIGGVCFGWGIKACDTRLILYCVHFTSFKVICIFQTVAHYIELSRKCRKIS